MAIVPTVEVVVKREKEVFNEFIAHNGHIIELRFLADRYADEDQRTSYSDDKLRKYLYNYVNSNIITPEELEAYSKVQDVSVETKIRRGEELIDQYVANFGHKDSYENILIDKYFKEDGGAKRYSKEDLRQLMMLFIKTTKNEEKKELYRKVSSTVSRVATFKNKYGTDLLEVILESNSKQEAVDFLKSINISKASLNTLLNIYVTLHPEEKSNQVYIANVISEVYPTKKKEMVAPKSRDAFLKSKLDSKMNRIERAKSMITEYLNSDEVAITNYLYEKYDLSEYQFNEALKDARTSGELDLKELLNMYDSKEASIYSMKKEISDKVIMGVMSGIQYSDGVVRKFNSYDYYNLYNKSSLAPMNGDQLYKFCLKVGRTQKNDDNASIPYTRGVLENIKKYCQTYLSGHRIVSDPEDLLPASNIIKDGIEISEENRLWVANYIFDKGWPLSVKLYEDSLRRLVIEQYDLYNASVADSDTKFSEEEQTQKMHK